MGGARQSAAQPAARGACRPVRQRLRLPRGARPRGRPRSHFTRRSGCARHAGSARAGTAWSCRASVGEAESQTGSDGMNERGNGVVHGLGDRLIGEVVEASTIEFLAPSVELDSAPPFGAFVEVANEDNLASY